MDKAVDFTQMQIRRQDYLATRPSLIRMWPSDFWRQALDKNRGEKRMQAKKMALPEAMPFLTGQPTR
jgi:hypothetical protein